MKNPVAALDSITIGKPQNVLVFHHDGFTLAGALVHAGIVGGSVTTEGWSRAVDFSTAVGEVLSQVRAAGVRRPPRHAVLVSASAIAALVDLPVDPQRPRPPAQMSELVRWELEPLFTQSTERWSIGALLMGRGYLDAPTRSDVMAEALSRNAAANQRITARFGEVAVSLGHVRREQNDACLALQERLVQLDEDLVCGWWPQRLEPDDEDGGDRRHSWFVSGIGDGLRRHWVRAFERNGIFLDTIYPALGAGFQSTAGGAGRERLYVDVQQEQFVVMRGRPGALRAYRVESLVDGGVNPAQVCGLCLEELRPDLEEILVNAPSADVGALRQSIADASKRPVHEAVSDNMHAGRAA